MLTALTDQDRYSVFAQKDRRYDGRLFMGVLTTGIFCRPACPARLPNFENVRFFDSAEGALKSGFRACKRCHPAAWPGEGSALVKRLISLIEEDPETVWRESDLRALGIDPSTARRQFKARFGLSFSAYARQRRLAHAAAFLTEGGKTIEAQLMAGFDSASGFCAAFGRIYGEAKSAAPPLLCDWMDTPMGPMMAIADEAALYLLEFADRKNMDRQVKLLSRHQGRPILVGKTDVHRQIRAELTGYFRGTLQSFQTPLRLTGTEYQKSVWTQLRAIPYGQTRSYAELAAVSGNPKGFRAAASANGRNSLAIIVPCHRVIGADGQLGGYAGGLGRKARLLELEAKNR